MFRAGCYIRARGAIMIIRTHFYANKSNSYGGTVKVEVAPAPGMCDQESIIVNTPVSACVYK